MRVTPSVLAFAGLLAGASADMERARELYHLTQYEESLKVLRAIPSKDSAVYDLMGRDYFMDGDFKKATEALEKAVAAEPANSNYALWLGRAYGRRAETSNPFTTVGYASKARQYFERSVELDPRNIEALNDLLDYYLEAPGILGGGMEKARGVVSRISLVDPAEGHWAQAKLDEKRQEFGSAEAQLRRAIDLAPHQVGRVVDLAKFLYKQGRYQEAEQSFARAEQLAPNNPKLLFAKADSYIQAGRNLAAAKSLLERYLEATITPDDPPKSQARKLLRQIAGG